MISGVYRYANSRAHAIQAYASNLGPWIELDYIASASNSSVAAPTVARSHEEDGSTGKLSTASLYGPQLSFFNGHGGVK